MANLPSFEELLRAVPEDKQHRLDSKVGEYQLAEIAINLTQWQDIVPYLGLKEAEETAIEGNHDTVERRRLVPCVCQLLVLMNLLLGSLIFEMRLLLRSLSEPPRRAQSIELRLQI